MRDRSVVRGITAEHSTLKEKNGVSVDTRLQENCKRVRIFDVYSSTGLQYSADVFKKIIKGPKLRFRYENLRKLKRNMTRYDN